MSTQYTPEHDFQELEYRFADGVEVALLWVIGTKDLFVLVHHERSGEILELPVEQGENGYDVFNHPYAYAAARGLECEAAARERVGGDSAIPPIRRALGDHRLPA